MSAQKRNNVAVDKLALYEKLVAALPGVERKGATHPYTSLNGHMFSCLHPPGSLALRFPEDEREKFLKKYKTTLFESYWRRPEGIRHRSRQVAEKYEGAAEVLHDELPVCPEPETKAVQKEGLMCGYRFDD